MPEIAEVARIVHFLKLHLVGKRIATAAAVDDGSVFGKTGTSGAAVEAALSGKKVLSAGSQGKFFWMTLDSPPHVVMHLGMTGWLHIRGQRTAYSNYYSKLKDDELSAWPPRFCKFHVTTADSPPVQAAFTDVRRFARVYLVDGPAAAIRHLCPLAGRGPDPVVDTHVFTLQWFSAALRLRRIPVKAWLLDQQNISGIGNWVADEALFHARIHPEQQTNMLDDAAAQALYHAVCYVCRTAVSLLGDSDRFPDHWLFNHRWSKASKQPPSLPNGQALSFVTVAGRTSCYAPALQSKTSPSRTPSDCQSQPAPNLPPGGAPHPKRRFASSSSQSALIDPESDDTCKQPNAPAKTAVDDVGERLQAPSRSAKRTRASQPASKTDVSTGRRRSARLRT